MRLIRLFVILTLAASALLSTSPVRAHVVDGNPVVTNHHQVGINSNVNIKYSKQDPCSANFGPACSVRQVSVPISTHAWNGVPNDSVRVALCNLRVITPPVGGGAQDGIGDPGRGCDWGNAQFTQLDSNGNCCVGGLGFYLRMPSSPTLSESRNPECASGTTGCNTQPEAVCPPTPGAIAAGWTCVIEVSDPATTGQPTHAGWRTVYLESPAPSIACGGHSCPPFIPTGTQVTVTGGQFPCKVRKPDDTVGTPTVYDGACIGKWTNKAISIKRLSTKTITSVVPTSQTAGIDGSYSVTFTMPSLPGSEQYKVMAHVGTCSLPCDSGNFTTAGKLFVHQ